MNRPTVTISIDTEEDDWGSYARSGAATDNILHLVELQELFERYGGRPTYLVNLPPLEDARARDVVRCLAERPGVEIGAHCHPWNTPPFNGAPNGEPNGAPKGAPVTMMSRLSVEVNRAKIRTVVGRLEDAFGVRPVTFRAGRWGFGPTVARALAEEGLVFDSSVSPFLDWSDSGGPDYSSAPFQPYRFDPDAPLTEAADGALVELPPTIGSFRGNHAAAARRRRRLERSFLQKLRVVGLLDRAGFITQRWLSPEMLDGPDLVRLASATVDAGHPFLGLTFHSCALLPGATPFVRDAAERADFLAAVEHFLETCAARGYRFMTLAEAGAELLATDDPS